LEVWVIHTIGVAQILERIDKTAWINIENEVEYNIGCVLFINIWMNIFNVSKNMRRIPL